MTNKHAENTTTGQQMTPLRRSLPFIFTLAIGIVVSFVLFAIVRNWEKEHQRIEFESRSMGHAHTLYHNLHDYIEGLQYVGDFFRNSEQVTRKEFSDFANSAIGRHPGIQGLGWNPLVLNSERAEYEARAREEGFENFVFTERTEENKLVRAAQRDEYIVVYYLEPLETNKPALGYDIASNPTRLNAINKAFDTGALSATDRIHLVQERGEQFGVLLLLPIYKQNVTLKTREDRRKHRKGLVVEVLRIGSAVENILEDISDKGIDVYLYDMSAEKANRFLYFRPSHTTGMTQQPLDMNEIQKGLYWSTKFDLADRQWQLLFSPSAFYLKSEQTWQAWFVLSGSLLLTCLLTFYLWRKSTYTADIEERVRIQTQTNLELEKEITERKKTEDDLKIKDRSIESSLSAIGIADAGGKIIYINDSLLHMWGYDNKDEMLGRGLTEFWDGNRINITIENTLKKGGDIGEDRGKRKDGSVFDVQFSSTLIKDNAGQPQYFFGSFLDISKQKNAEQELMKSEVKFRSVVESSPMGMHMYKLESDNKLVFTGYNHAADQILGLDNSQFIGMTIEDAFPSLIDTDIPDHYRHAAAEGKAWTTEQITYEDEKISGAFEVHAFQTERNTMVAMFLDVTERKEAEKEQERLTSEIMIKNKELEQLLYVTSHDLRSPLVNISGYSRLLEQTLQELTSSIEHEKDPLIIKDKMTPIVKEDISDSLHYIQTSVLKMETLLKGILSLSRLGRIVLKMEEIDMNKMMRNIIDSHRFRLNELSIEMEISTLPDCMGDSTQINQVFSNLLDNAIKYSDPERSSVIHISGHKDGDHSVYCMDDNGIGIAPEHHDKIFEIFHQLKPDRVKGEGMGLTIAYRILEKHKGKIWVESELGIGSRFFVSLPS